MLSSSTAPPHQGSIERAQLSRLKKMCQAMNLGWAASTNVFTDPDHSGGIYSQLPLAWCGSTGDHALLLAIQECAASDSSMDRQHRSPRPLSERLEFGSQEFGETPSKAVTRRHQPGKKKMGGKWARDMREPEVSCFSLHPQARESACLYGHLHSVPPARTVR